MYHLTQCFAYRVLGAVDERGVDVLERILPPAGGGKVDHQDHPRGQEVSLFFDQFPSGWLRVVYSSLRLIVEGLARELHRHFAGISGDSVKRLCASLLVSLRQDHF